MTQPRKPAAPTPKPQQDRSFEVGLMVLFVSHFDRLAHQWSELQRPWLYGRVALLLYDAVAQSFADGGHVTPSTVRAKLAAVPDITDADDFLSQAWDLCGDAATGPSEAPALLEMVKLDATRRAVVAGLSDATAQAQTAPLAQARAFIASAAQDADQRIAALDAMNDLAPSSAFVREIVDAWQALERGQTPPMFSTGLRSLDILLGGIENRDSGVILGGGFVASSVCAVLGATKSGKTSLVHAMIRRMALDAGIPVVVASTEMTRRQVGQRLIMGEGRIPHVAMKIPNYMNIHQVNRFHAAAAAIERAPILVWDRPFIHRKALFSLASSLHAQGQCEVLVIDHLQRMQPTPEEEARNAPRQEVLRAVVADAKEWANKTGGLVLIPTQLGDEPDRERRMPRPNETAECRTVAWEVDYALGVYRPHAYFPTEAHPNHASIALLVSRVADTGECDLWWDGACTNFAEPPPGFNPPLPRPPMPPKR